MEIKPGFGYLGSSGAGGFSEAAELKTSHAEVVKNIKSKQSPVEDLLRQADDLIAKQKPRAEVYSAMADSLGVTWRDLNAQLEVRGHILDQNYLFHGHFRVS